MNTKLILFNMVTIDGFFEGPNDTLDWHNVDAEFQDFAVEQLQTVKAIVFGRKTYTMMANYWPTADAIKNDPLIAAMMNNYPKIVFSKSLDHTTWSNTRLIKHDAVTEMTKLKQSPALKDKDLVIFGSDSLSASFVRHGLIDEFRMMVNPTVLGNGTRLFRDLQGELHLDLIRTRVFGNGNVLLIYQPAHAKSGRL